LTSSISGTHFNYYFHCHRHLWLFANTIQMEHNSENVAMGKFISESSYDRKEHEIRIDNISLDFYDKKNKVIHEIKKSNKMEELHLWQVKYYISVLESKGIEGVTAEIDYPLLKQKIKVELTEGDRVELKKSIEAIEKILSMEIQPDIINKPFCKECSYYELCYV